MMKYLKTAAVWFAVAFVSTLVAQFAQIQSALNAGDWDTAKKVGIAALVGAFTGGIGAVLSHAQAVWFVGDPAPKTKP